MNIALGALIILLLLLPAFFFRIGVVCRRYSNKGDKASSSFPGELARRNFINLLSKLNFSETLFFFSIIPLMQHLLSVCLIDRFGYEIDFQLLLNIFSSQKDVIQNNAVFNVELTSFLKYVLWETLAGFLLGLLVTQCFIWIPSLNLWLVGENMYLRLFTGLLLDTDKRKNVDLVLVDVVSETKEATVIYSGILEKFDISPDKNELTYITISAARRRDLRKNSQVTEVAGSGIKITSYDNDSGDMIVIPGKYFTIPGSKISNVNVTYIDVQTVTDAAGNVTTTLVPVG
nr:hypothetical protein [Mucilaginibacter sp. SP1R1]MBB6149593.1 hypothetical protein [Mucilaginibacter sp. SP1R1]